MLKKLVDESRFEAHAAKIRKNMSKSWTTVGMNSAMEQFFRELLEGDLTNLLSEGHLAEKMVGAIYRRYNYDTRARHLATLFTLAAPAHAIAVKAKFQNRTSPCEP